MRLVVRALRNVTFAAVALLAGAVHAETIDVQDFEAQIEKRLGQEITVAGRFGSLAADQIKLVGSRLEFRLTELARGVRAGTKNVELSGKAVRENGRIVFRVDNVRPMPSDLEQFHERRKNVRAGDYAAIYELSRWARAAGQRYDDLELRDLATTAYREAFQIEEAALVGQGDGEALLAMAERGKSLGLQRPEVMRLTHRGLWLLRASLKPDDVPGRAALAERIAKLLPAGTQAEPVVDPDRRAAYLADAIGIYDKADGPQRMALHRVLWADLTRERLRLELAQEALPARLAEEAARLLPEFPELVREFRLADLHRQAADVGALARGKVLALRRDFTELGVPDAGDKLLDEWLAAQQEALPQGDAEARLRLAADYRNLVGDMDAAVALYQQAWQIAPGLAETERELRALGYEWIGGVWLRTSQLRASQMEAKRRQRIGGIAVGDNEAAVVARLRRPDRIARTLTSTAVFEQWIYDGPPTTYIYLRRSKGSREALVTAIEGPTAESEPPEAR